MKSLVKLILKFFKDGAYSLLFLSRMIYHKEYINRIKKTCTGTLVLLANGPSLKDVIPLIEKDDKFKNVDFVVLNYFALESIFFKIKPRKYCLADSAFFRDSNEKERVLQVYSTFQEKVNWDLNLYIPRQYLKEFKTFYNLTNPNIKIIPANANHYNGFENLRFKLYDKGLSMPEIYTVAHLSIYVGINSGYNKILLYGVDHTYFNSLYINDKNQLCYKDEHFYDKKDVQSKECCKDGCPLKISEYLYDKFKVFKSHDILAAYAKYKGVKIINCTKGSMIDSYERIS